ncbi:MAG: PHB depolymerase family esterase [Lysobacteraceae bacterium]
MLVGASVSALLLGVTGCSEGNAAPPLERLNLDPDRVAVAGLSSGAYMATQAHVAFSDHLRGAALLAGGPYACAGGDLGTALGTCMKAAPSAPDVDVLATRVRERAADGRIAPLSGLEGDHVWVWRGEKDVVVAEAVSSASADLYRELGVGDVVWDGELDAGHGFPVSKGDGSCETPEKPYLAACGFDAAGALVKALYGDEASESVAVEPGQLRRFDQQSLVDPDGVSPQLADDGFLYVPKACGAGERCGLLVAFHGCEQNADNVGEAFVSGSGINDWADRYRLVVLYPQTKASLAPLNPKACWDWWGYTGANYDTRDGAQLKWLNNATSVLGVPLR